MKKIGILAEIIALLASDPYTPPLPLPHSLRARGELIHQLDETIEGLKKQRKILILLLTIAAIWLYYFIA